jgi:hypothetical protein
MACLAVSDTTINSTIPKQLRGSLADATLGRPFYRLS